MSHRNQCVFFFLFRSMEQNLAESGKQARVEGSMLGQQNEGKRSHMNGTFVIHVFAVVQKEEKKLTRKMLYNPDFQNINNEIFFFFAKRKIT